VAIFEDADEDRKPMTRNVPYLSEEEIERDAAALLAEYEAARTVTIEPPIPIEDIIEKHLKLGFEFSDAHRLFGVPRSGPNSDILGALFFDERRIVIDESLDPEEYPSNEGRYRFTLAHEGGGHWRLHRRLFARDPAQAGLFDAPEAPTFICRTSQAKAREEWQADFYASCLLMPRKLVFVAWDQAFPDRKQRVLQPTTKIDHPFVEIERFGSCIPGAEFTEREDQTLERFAKPFAKKFGVSSIAMRIRLENLGLLHRVVPGQHLIERLDQLAFKAPT
jgi:Zn-dependent peptidase ImmA (M78 family)